MIEWHALLRISIYVCIVCGRVSNQYGRTIAHLFNEFNMAESSVRKGSPEGRGTTRSGVGLLSGVRSVYNTMHLMMLFICGEANCINMKFTIAVCQPIVAHFASMWTRTRTSTQFWKGHVAKPLVTARCRSTARFPFYQI